MGEHFGDGPLGFKKKGQHQKSPPQSPTQMEAVKRYKKKFETEGLCLEIWKSEYINMEVSNPWGYPQIIHVNRIFHHKPSSYLGTPIAGGRSCSCGGQRIFVQRKSNWLVGEYTY
jgi:hypothetical protein